MVLNGHMKNCSLRSSFGLGTKYPTAAQIGMHSFTVMLGKQFPINLQKQEAVFILQRSESIHVILAKYSKGRNLNKSS